MMHNTSQEEIQELAREVIRAIDSGVLPTTREALREALDAQYYQDHKDDSDEWGEPVCRRCNGSGQAQEGSAETCARCFGSGIDHCNCGHSWQWHKGGLPCASSGCGCLNYPPNPMDNLQDSYTAAELADEFESAVAAEPEQVRDVDRELVNKATTRSVNEMDAPELEDDNCNCDTTRHGGSHSHYCSSNAPPHDRCCEQCGYIVTECRCSVDDYGLTDAKEAVSQVLMDLYGNAVLRGDAETVLHTLIWNGYVVPRKDYDDLCAYRQSWLDAAKFWQKESMRLQKEHEGLKHERDAAFQARDDWRNRGDVLNNQRLAARDERDEIWTAHEQLVEALQRIANGPARGESIGWEWGAEHANNALNNINPRFLNETKRREIANQQYNSRITGDVSQSGAEPTPWETPEDAGRISVENMEKQMARQDDDPESQEAADEKEHIIAMVAAAFEQEGLPEDRITLDHFARVAYEVITTYPTDAPSDADERPNCTCNSRQVDGHTNEQVHESYCDKEQTDVIGGGERRPKAESSLHHLLRQEGNTPGDHSREYEKKDELTKDYTAKDINQIQAIAGLIYGDPCPGLLDADGVTDVAVHMQNQLKHLDGWEREELVDLLDAVTSEEAAELAAQGRRAASESMTRTQRTERERDDWKARAKHAEDCFHDALATLSAYAMKPSQCAICGEPQDYPGCECMMSSQDDLNATCRRCGERPHRYSPDHPEHGPQGRADWMGCINSLLTRAENAERELYRLRMCVAALDCQCYDGSQCPSCYARAALAGQDADAGEPWDKAKLLDALDAVPRRHLVEAGHERDYWRNECREAIGRASRAESAAAAAGSGVGSESADANARRCTEACSEQHTYVWPCEQTINTDDAETNETTRNGVCLQCGSGVLNSGEHIRDDLPPCGGDGRDRAIHAASILLREAGYPNDEAEYMAERVIDAALDSGGVFTHEAVMWVCKQREQRAQERDEATDRINKLKAALPNPDKLEGIASWFDIRYGSRSSSDLVQQDLREWARRIRSVMEED